MGSTGQCGGARRHKFGNTGQVGELQGSECVGSTGHARDCLDGQHRAGGGNHLLLKCSRTMLECLMTKDQWLAMQGPPAVRAPNTRTNGGLLKAGTT